MNKIIDFYKKIEKYKYIVIIIFIILISAICYYINKNNIENIEYENEIISQEIKLDPMNNTESECEQNTIIKIHISGEIKNPGIYELKEDSRIADAINLAGGLSELACLDSVNLAYVLTDGEKIEIPSINNENDVNNKSEENEKSNSYEKIININKASVLELMEISGIGESTAKKIVEYRNENGSFKKIEDIKKVSGIGENKYNQIKDYIKVK